jgi:arabinose-5-phosphate isomerase
MPDLSLARRVLQTEAAAVLALADRVGERFAEAVGLVRDCKGHVILTGMGKSGIICRKIAATLSSTGTSALFLHPAEALHGDLGVLRSEDVVIALSYSGENEELVRILEALKRLGTKLIAMTADSQSTLALAADVALDCRVSEEACPMNLVPTASTTAMLALGDALAMTVLVEKGFQPDDFAKNHPAGSLGKRLRRVGQLMRSGDLVPVVSPVAAMPDVLDEISNKGLGMACVVDAQNTLLGIITDGDLRRTLKALPNVLERTAADVMTRNPVTVTAATMAAEALKILEERKITALVVVDSNRRVQGVIHVHHLWRTDLF